MFYSIWHLQKLVLHYFWVAQMWTVWRSIKIDYEFVMLKLVNIAREIFTFYNLALGVSLAGFDDLIVDRVQLKTVGFVPAVHDISDMDILQGNDTLGLLVLKQPQHKHMLPLRWILSTLWQIKEVGVNSGTLKFSIFLLRGGLDSNRYYLSTCEYNVNTRTPWYNFRM